jgi:hypothetical protein
MIRAIAAVIGTVRLTLKQRFMMHIPRECP